MTGDKMPDRGLQTEASREKPFNNKMNILKALGILLVVGGHAELLSLTWFPPNSFHMPLFFFISGYFFHDKDFISFVKSKVKHLVIPLLSWNLVFGILCTILLSCGIVHFGHPLSLKTLFIDSFTYGQAFEFNVPNWFVGTLVEVQIIYWLLHRLFKRNHVILLLLTLLFYIVAWTMADNQVHEFCGYGVLALEKVLFVLIFYEMGSVYHLFLEKKDSFSVNRIACLALFNGFLLGFVNPDLNTTVALMKVPHQMFLPLLTALSGIYLYLQIAELLKDKVKRKSLLGYIGEHTFSIMALHMFFFWCLNGVYYLLKMEGVFPLRSFDYEKYTHNIFLHISEHAPMNDVFYFLAGMGGSLLCVYLYEKAKPYLLKFVRSLCK